MKVRAEGIELKTQDGYTFFQVYGPKGYIFGFHIAMNNGELDVFFPGFDEDRIFIESLTGKYDVTAHIPAKRFNHAV
jgi:hypothetical protein